MAGPSLDARAAMDRMYRWQCHIYDPTRKAYLLGRDRTLAAMALRPGERALEVGCGTGRNLVRLARLYPGVELVGIDASAAMLATAARRIGSANLDHRVRLWHRLAEDFTDPRPFDAVLFSYALSMIPSWRTAIDRAAASLRPGGAIHVVDFWDQRRLPPWFRAVLRRWLALFDVECRPQVLAYFGELAAAAGGDIEIEAVARRYAYRLRYARP